MANTVYQPHKSTIGGISANYVAVACYVAAIVCSYIPILNYVAWLAPLAIYFLEKESALVKFHAVQALILNAAGAFIYFILGIVGLIVINSISSPSDISVMLAGPSVINDYNLTVEFIGKMFNGFALIITVLITVLEIWAALNALKYTEYKIPVIGAIAEKVSKKLSKVNFGGTNPATPPPSETWNPPTQGYTPPTQPYTPPAPPAQQWTAPAQPYTPPAPVAPPAQPAFDTQTGQPITPPEPPVEAPPAQKFDTETGLPIDD